MTAQAKSPFIWYDLMTSDLDQAVAFYKAVVGWEIRDSGSPGMTYMLFGNSGKDVGGMVSWNAVGESQPTKWSGHIHTPDVDAETAAVVADGGREIKPPQDIPGVGRFSVVTDPQGADYLLFQPNLTEAPPRLKPADLGAVSWHELSTTDWEKAWEFYSKHYGWAKDMAVDMGPMGTYQVFKLEGETFAGGMMNLPPNAPTHPAWLFYFTVEDINAAAQRIKDNGGSILYGPNQVPGGAWTLQAVDPQGGHFAVTATR